jgi:hypothetical protein
MLVPRDAHRLIPAPVKGLAKPPVKGFADFGLLAWKVGPKGRGGIALYVRLVLRLGQFGDAWASCVATVRSCRTLRSQTTEGLPQVGDR